MKAFILTSLVFLATQLGCAGDECETSADCAPNQVCLDTGGVLFSGRECVGSLDPSQLMDAEFDQNTSDMDSRPDAPIAPNSDVGSDVDMATDLDMESDFGTDCVPGEVVSDGENRTCVSCAEGAYSTTTNALSCAAWTDCVPGEFESQRPTVTSDRVCEGCSIGTYSNTANAGSCVVWIECGATQYILVEGTQTTDRQCAPLKGVGEACVTNAECQNNECQRGYCKLPEFSVIPQGIYTQGSPSTEPGRQPGESQRVARIDRPFFLSETPVTQSQWQALMGNNPSNWKSGSSPVETVSWWDALAYMNALSDAEGLDQCYGLSDCDKTPGESGYFCETLTFVGLDCTGYRLPTEAEWEYAARAGTTTMTYAGDHGGAFNCNAEPTLSSIAWWCANSGGSTRAVASLLPNAWGLYDMFGNAAQWNWDWYGASYGGDQTDPVGPISGSNRVYRGCPIASAARFCRTAYRNSADPEARLNSVGFRPARTIP